jgi:hypothetical protein
VEIRVERGRPTPEELAAVVALVRARAAAPVPGEESVQPLNAWADPARTMPRPMPRPGPDAWRMSAWPA